MAPAWGGGILGYDSHGHDWLRRAGQAAVGDGHPEELACFPLVPYSNRIRDGVFDFGGRRVALRPGTGHALHGHGWRARWSVVERSASWLRIEYRHEPDDWPFSYRATQVFRLGEEGLTVALAIVNEGLEAMPCGIGLHPYFPRTPGCTVAARVGAMWESDADVLPLRLSPLPTSLPLDRGIRPSEHALDAVFTGWRSKAMIEWPERGCRLALRASSLLSHLVVYSPPGEDYFCVEPVSNCTDAFNLASRGREDTGLIVLRPSERAEAEVAFLPALW